MLARKGALRVASGSCALPSRSVPRHGLLFTRSGQQSRLADRTGKLALGQCRLDHRVPLGVEGHGAHRCPVPGLAAPAARVRLTCLLIDFVPGSQQRTILAGMALCRRDVADTAIPICVLERSKVFPARAGMNRCDTTASPCCTRRSPGTGHPGRLPRQKCRGLIEACATSSPGAPPSLHQPRRPDRDTAALICVTVADSRSAYLIKDSHPVPLARSTGFPNSTPCRPPTTH